MDSTATPQKHRWRLKMPGAFTILFFLTVIAVMLTWVVPAGSYSKLQYTNNHLQVTKPSGAKESLPATQATLDKLNVKIDIQQFKSGAISIKSMAFLHRFSIGGGMPSYLVTEELFLFRATAPSS